MGAGHRNHHDEEEYFHEGRNGLAPLRPTGKNSKTRLANGPVRLKPQAVSSGRSSAFLQGIVLGAVLLIPVGAWYTMRSSDAGAAAIRSTMDSGKNASKAAKSAAAAAAAKRKPRVNAANGVATQPVGNMPAEALPTPGGDIAPPPDVAVPQPAAGTPLPPAMTRMPSIVADDTVIDEKPKKSLWKKMAAPFRGGSNSKSAAKDGTPAEDPHS